MSLQTCMTFLLLWNTKRVIYNNVQAAFNTMKANADHSRFAVNNYFIFNLLLTQNSHMKGQNVVYMLYAKL